MIVSANGLFPLNSINHLILVTVKCCVFFVVWPEFLNIIWMSFSFKGLMMLYHIHKFYSTEWQDDYEQ
jgi:hypothetical protein